MIPPDLQAAYEDRRKVLQQEIRTVWAALIAAEMAHQEACGRLSGLDRWYADMVDQWRPSLDSAWPDILSRAAKDGNPPRKRSNWLTLIGDAKTTARTMLRKLDAECGRTIERCGEDFYKVSKDGLELCHDRG